MLTTRLRDRALFSSLLFSSLLTTSVGAQTLEPPYEDDSYPFTTVEAIASENATGSAPNTNLAIVGSGAGVLPLDVSSSATPALLSTTGDPRGFLQGVAKEIKIQRGVNFDRVYVAAGVSGVDSLDPASASFDSDPSFPWEPSNEEIQCFAVAPFDVNGWRYLFVGANDSERGGKVHLLWHDPLSSTPVHQATVDIGEPVLSLEVSTSLVLDTVTLFVGTGKGLPVGPCVAGAIHRFDLPSAPFQGSGSSISFPSPVTYSEPSGLIIKDLVIHETYQMLFAAAYGKGVLRLDIYGLGQLQAFATSSLATCTNGVAEPWPALVTPQRKIRSLALSPDESQLVVGIGSNIASEEQHFGSCGTKVACDGSTVGQSDYGLRILTNIGDPTAGPCCVAVYKPRTSSPRMYAVATRAENPANPSGPYMIDCAAFTEGYKLLRYDSAGTGLSDVSNYVDGMVFPGADDAVVMDFGNGNKQLYVAQERGVVRLGDIGGPVGNGNLLSTQPTASQFAHRTAIWLTSFESPQRWVLGSSNSDASGERGISFFNVQGQDPIALPRVLDNEGSNNIGLDGVTAPTDTLLSQAGTQQQWLCVINNKDDQSAATIQGPGFRVWDVEPVLSGQQTDPNNGNAPKVAEYVDGLLPGETGLPTRRQFGDIFARTLNNTTTAIYVAYSPAPGLVDSGGNPIANAETTIGVMTFKLEVVTTPIDQSYNLTFQAKNAVPGSPVLSDFHPLRLNWDEASKTVYSSHACLGVARFDFSGNDYVSATPEHRPALDPFDPTGQGKLTAYQAGATGTGNLYVVYLQGLIEVFTPGNFANPTGPVVARYDVRRFPNQLIPDPSGIAGSFYLANGRSGVSRITLP